MNKSDMRAVLTKYIRNTSVQEPVRKGGYCSIVLEDKDIKTTVSLVFANMGGEIDPKLIKVDNCKDGNSMGAVIVLPSFWLDELNRDLAINYIIGLIENLYDEMGWKTYIPPEEPNISMPTPTVPNIPGGPFPGGPMFGIRQA